MRRRILRRYEITQRYHVLKMSPGRTFAIVDARSGRHIPHEELTLLRAIDRAHALSRDAARPPP